METAQYKTPYEKYVREGIDAEKRNLDNLYNEFAKSNSINKQVVKRKIDETIQNIELLQKQLEKYGAGLSWLREPSKERDEKAEHLEKIQEEPQKPATAPSTPAAKPTVGSPGTSCQNAKLELLNPQLVLQSPQLELLSGQRHKLVLQSPWKRRTKRKATKKNLPEY